MKRLQVQAIEHLQDNLKVVSRWVLTSERVFIVIVLDERRHPAALYSGFTVKQHAKLKRQEDFEKFRVVQV